MKKKLLIKVVKGDEAKKPQLAEARYQLKGLAVTVYRNFMYLADLEAEQRGFKPNLDNVSFQQVFDAMTEAFFTGNKVMEIPLVNGDNDVFQLDISNIDSIEEFNEMVDEMKREAKKVKPQSVATGNAAEEEELELEGDAHKQAELLAGEEGQSPASSEESREEEEEDELARLQREMAQ